MFQRGDIPKPESGGALITALSELASVLQRMRTTDDVLQTAGSGLARLGMRMVVFRLSGDDLLLRYLSTSAARHEALERELKRPLRDLRAPALACAPLVSEVIGRRVTVFHESLRLFDNFLFAAAGYDASHLEGAPSTASVCNGVVAPLFVQRQPWGVLEVVSHALTQRDAPAVSLFASHVASALEVAESLGALERANEDLTRAQRELVKRERLAALGEVAAIMAHEVRNPLGVLFNSISSLRRIIRSAQATAPMSEADALLSIASEEAERLNHIVSDLLDFANPSPPRFELASLQAVLEEVVDLASGHPALADVVLKTEVEPGLPLVEMDRRWLHQALFNLVVNALEAMPGRGALVLRAVAGRECVQIDVTDTGPGIPQGLQERIFEPFFTTKSFGTGLGLAVVKRVIEAHHGEVAVVSAHGGTTLTLRVPLAQAPISFAAAALGSGARSTAELTAWPAAPATGPVTPPSA